MTNADRIRSMTDEELAKWFYVRTSDCVDCPADDLCNVFAHASCEELLLRWLKQEVDE